MTVINRFLTQYEYIPCYWFYEKPERHPHFTSLTPSVVVLHCGWKRADLAGYMADPRTTQDDKYATLCPDKKWRRQVSVHFAWEPKREDFVQMLPLDVTGWHVGTAKWQGMRVQAVSYGIEGPGPVEKKRDDKEMGAWQRLLIAMKLNEPSLATIIGHLSLTKDRLDPGPFFKWDYMINIGYSNVVLPFDQ
jgi:hypothetical protein